MTLENLKLNLMPFLTGQVRPTFYFDGILCSVQHKAESKTSVNTPNEKQK